MAACIWVKSWCILLVVKEIVAVKNATAYTEDWERHLVGDRV
jgi:hypothetical protein